MEVMADQLRFLDIVIRNGERHVILDDPKLSESKDRYVAPTYNQTTTQFNPSEEFKLCDAIHVAVRAINSSTKRNG